MNAKRTINLMDCTTIYSNHLERLPQENLFQSKVRIERLCFLFVQKLWYACHSFLFQEFSGKEAFLVGYLWRDICSGRILQKTQKKHILQKKFDPQQGKSGCAPGMSFFCGKFHLLIKIFSRFLAEHRSVALWKRKDSQERKRSVV